MQRALLLLLVLSTFAIAKDWQTGKLVSVTKDIDVVNSERVFTVEIQHGDTLYVGQRTLINPSQRAPLFTEGDTVQFALEGDRLIAIEEHGREFKMKVLKKKRL